LKRLDAKLFLPTSVCGAVQLLSVDSTRIGSTNLQVSMLYEHHVTPITKSVLYGSEILIIEWDFEL